MFLLVLNRNRSASSYGPAYPSPSPFDRRRTCERPLTADEVDFPRRVVVVHLHVDNARADPEGREDGGEEAKDDREEEQAYHSALPI